MPGSVLLKAINDEDGIRMLPEEQQLLRTENMFHNEYIPQYRRQTVVTFPLFVGEDMYGMLVAEMDSSNLTNVTPVSYQLAVTMKSLFMIEEQNRAKENLEASLNQFIEDNSRLDTIAKSDELTGLYNRRGFLDYAQKEIGKPENKGKRALICYADMDNLKYVNDKFGHDDGDFALREIAAILKDTFREKDIIGRMGGDEFIVFALIQVSDYEKQIKDSLHQITKHNEGGQALSYRDEYGYHASSSAATISTSMRSSTGLMRSSTKRSPRRRQNTGLTGDLKII